MRSESPYIGFFPALPLAKNLELGEWIAGTPPPETPWAPGRFRELSESLISSFEKRNFKGGALLWHRDRGFDGSLPPDEDIAAIRAAVAFAVLDANDRLADDGNKAHFMATTENADLFLQPIDEGGGITHTRLGGLKQIHVAGMKIGGEPPPLADAVERILSPVPASTKLAGAIYSAIRSNTGRGPAIATAAEWHRGALANPAAISTQFRLIVLTTGFEALLGGDNARKRAELLRALFERETASHRHLTWPWIGLLWSPTEKTNLQRSYVNPSGKTKPDQRSELEEWFMALADARNDIIHEGRLKTGLYPAPPERPLSRYAGTLFWRGERVLREAIKATLGPEVLLCGPLAEQALLESLVAESKDAPADPPLPAPKPDPLRVALLAKIKSEPRAPDRDLPALLVALGCNAANLVVLSKAHGYPSPSPEVALESSLRAEDKWHADVGGEEGKGITISEAERDTLRAAGAEDELSNFSYPCD